MYLIVTRAFPPEFGGMQSLMWGLSKEMSKNFMIKVFADYQENHKEFDNKENFSIERVGGIKFLRKIRKAQLVNEFLKENKVQGIIADHWKSLELIKTDKKKYCLIHGKEINHPKGSLLNKRVIKVLNNVDQVIANSEYTKNLTGGVHNVFIYENHIYALSAGQRFYVINIDDPKNPYEVGMFEIGEEGQAIHDVWVEDGIAYTSNWKHGVYMVDVGNGIAGGSPSNPMVISNYSYESGAHHATFPF